MFYTVYKVTNKINQKIYIGAHKTKDPYDDYKGSGSIITSALNKYGRENFEKEILYFLDTEEEMYLKEKEIVDTEFLSRPDTYNLKEGGDGGWEYVNKNGKNLYHDNSGNCLNGNWENFKNIIEIYQSIQNYLRIKNDGSYENFCEALSISIKLYYSNGGVNGFYGKTHTEETKRKIGEASSVHQSGEGNSQYGTMWIHNNELNLIKKIKKVDLYSWEQNGWIKGRVDKKSKTIEKECRESNILNSKLEKEYQESNILNSKLEKALKTKELYTNYYDIYNKVGFTEFVKITSYEYSQENLVNMMKKYVDCFVPQNGKKRLS